MLRFGLTLAALTLVLGSASAQAIKITRAKIGFPTGAGRNVANTFGGEPDGTPPYICKANQWAPVYVDFEMLREVTDPAVIVIESSDSDSLGTSTVVPLMSLADKVPTTRIQTTELPYIPMVRIAGRELTVSIRNAKNGRLLADPYRFQYLQYRNSNSYVVLALGSPLPGFELPEEPKQQNNYANNPRVELASIDNINMLPDRWYGYDGADLVVLCTGTASVQNFLDPLFNDPQQKPRLDALIEWVRRGGRLVVSIGSNALLLANMATLQELLPVTIRKENPTEQVRALVQNWRTKTTNKALGTLSGKSGSTFPLLTTTPKADRGHRVIVPSDETEGPDVRPAVWQAPYGLGRVSLIGFDIDRSPFIEFEQRAAIWELILKECGSDRSSSKVPNQNNYGYYGEGVLEDELASELRGHTDWFAGVPVISFGWVALFIILYTLLIGPIEYFVLKKVFKRLELTWITFPIIVLSVSAIAYFSAYAMKGSDMKVNKVDQVDIDLSTNRLYGRSWVTVFSPRIDTYKVGIDPKENWIAKGEQPHGGTLVDWSGGGRSSKSSFFRRSYSYQLGLPNDPKISTFEEGLVDVPIQVWSTKAFTADWSALMDKQKPLVVSNLYHPPADRDSKLPSVAGQFTLNLPFKELTDVYLIYAGKVYRPTTDTAPITPGHIENVFLDDSRLERDGLQKVMGLANLHPSTTNTNMPYQRNRYTATRDTSTGVAPLFNLQFHEWTLGNNAALVPQNSTLRRLDQSWRMSPSHFDELIVIGRTKKEQDVSAEEMMSSETSNSPTRLWLKELPGRNKTRTPQQGMIQQETFVRIYIPIKPLKK